MNRMYRKVKDASARGVKLPTSNLYFYGTKYDISGNKCAVFSFGANSRKWSVQASSYGISKGISYMPSNTKPEDILVNDEVASKLERNVINYINEYGSSKLKDQLYIYDSARRKTTGRRIKDDDFGFPLAGAANSNDRYDIDKAMAAFESVFNEDNVDMLQETYFNKEKEDKNKYAYMYAYYDFIHPNVTFPITSGYSCGSKKIDEIIQSKFGEMEDEFVNEYSNGKIEGDIDEMAFDDTLELFGDRMAITYAIELRLVQQSVEITFVIGAGDYTSFEFGKDMILQETASNDDEIRQIAQEICDIVNGIHFD